MTFGEQSRSEITREAEGFKDTNPSAATEKLRIKSSAEAERSKSPAFFAASSHHLGTVRDGYR